MENPGKQRYAIWETLERCPVNMEETKERRSIALWKVAQPEMKDKPEKNWPCFWPGCKTMHETYKNINDISQ